MTAKISRFNIRPHFNVQARDFTLSLGQKTAVMGIINVTTDSFSGDGVKSLSAYRLALQHIKEGADLIDIGGESSRPGARIVSAKEEIQRVVPLIKKLAKIIKVPLSVDTHKGLTAQHSLDAGASIINNIRGTNAQKDLLKMAVKYNAAVVVMHMRGTSRTMQKKTSYKNLIADIIMELKIAVENCLEIGIKSDKIIVDPGIGFAKTSEQNLELINRLNELQTLRKPILIGTSRKSFIGKILNTGPQQRLAGSIASAMIAVARGAHIIRAHDVAEVVQAARVTDAIIK